MNYRITRGDLEITKNVLKQIIQDKFRDFEAELRHFEKETECPSYDLYNNLIETLCHIENFQIED